MMLIPRQVSVWVSILACVACVSCAGMDSTSAQAEFGDRIVSISEVSPIITIPNSKQIEMRNRDNEPLSKREIDLGGELRDLGVGKLEPLDLGFYGKLGPNSIFVADRSVIPTYDRLYWAMVRILSEKYGCFIRRKIDRGPSVSFQCRDRRTVTMARKISGRFSLLHVRQYDRFGRVIESRNTDSTISPSLQLAAKRRERGSRQNP